MSSQIQKIVVPMDFSDVSERAAYTPSTLAARSTPRCTLSTCCLRPA